MKTVYKFGPNGKYIEPVEIYPDENGVYKIPIDCTEKQLPQPNWKPIFQNGDWVETATEEEKQPRPQEPSQLELMQQALDELILGGSGL